MKRFNFLLALMMVVILAMTGVSLAAETLWVSSTNAKLKSDKTASSDTVTTLDVGAELTVLKTDGKWHQVKTASGKKGWIYRGKVSDTKPDILADEKSGDDGLGGLLGGLTGSGINAESTDSSRSIRGLSPEAEAYANQTGKPKAYREALDAVLAVKTSDKEIEQFLKNGHIGEYAE